MNKKLTDRLTTSLGVLSALGMLFIGVAMYDIFPKYTKEIATTGLLFTAIGQVGLGYYANKPIDEIFRQLKMLKDYTDEKK
jgi:hypothetical protein